jgi:hypothetical protein
LTEVVSTEVEALKVTLEQEEGFTKPESEAKEMLTEPLLLICTLVGTVRVTEREADEVPVESASTPLIWTLAVESDEGTVVPLGNTRRTVETPGLKRPWLPTLKVMV